VVLDDPFETCRQMVYARYHLLMTPQAWTLLFEKTAVHCQNLCYPVSEISHFRQSC